MSQWSEYYKSRVGDTYPQYVIEKYFAFLKEIIHGKSLREEGCGIASVTKALKILGYKKEISCFDLDFEQVQLAKENLKSDCPYIGNIFDNHGFVDIIFSHGVLEHFTDEQILKIINRQKSEANKVVHYIPSNKYTKPSFGDERLLSKDYWNDVFKPKEIIEFNNGFDLVAIWQLNFLLMIK